MGSCSFTCLGHRASMRAESTATTRFPAPGISLPALIVGQSPSWDEHAILSRSSPWTGLGRSSRAGGVRWRNPTLHAGSRIGQRNATGHFVELAKCLALGKVVAHGAGAGGRVSREASGPLRRAAQGSDPDSQRQRPAGSRRRHPAGGRPSSATIWRQWG